MKHTIHSDEKMNPVLKEEVSELRGGMYNQAEKNELPKRFISIPSENTPSIIITDTETDRETTVSLFAYGGVRKALNDLFKEE